MAYDSTYLRKMAAQNFLHQCKNDLRREKAQEMREAREAVIIQQHANYHAKLFEEEKRELEAYQLQLEKDGEKFLTATILQKTFSDGAKARIAVANKAYQQKLKAMKTKIKDHETSITGLQLQLDMVKAELISFDIQDAIDMQLEDERRLSESAISARLEREAKRTFKEDLVKTLSNEIADRTHKIDRLKTDFELYYKNDCKQEARIQLRVLKNLKANNVHGAHGDKKFRYWNSIRRATTRASPAAEDVQVFEDYRQEMNRPVRDEILAASSQTYIEEMNDYVFSRVQEQNGSFSMAGIMS
jgi:hypothetical protein